MAPHDLGEDMKAEIVVDHRVEVLEEREGRLEARKVVHHEAVQRVDRQDRLPMALRDLDRILRPILPQDELSALLNRPRIVLHLGLEFYDDDT